MMKSTPSRKKKEQGGENINDDIPNTEETKMMFILIKIIRN